MAARKIPSGPHADTVESLINKQRGLPSKGTYANGQTPPDDPVENIFHEGSLTRYPRDPDDGDLVVDDELEIRRIALDPVLTGPERASLIVIANQLNIPNLP